MKRFTRNNFIRKLMISIVCIILLNFCFTPVTKASNFGGKLMGYIRPFATTLADAAGSVVQLGMTGKWAWAVDSDGTGEPNGDYWIKSSKFNYPILQISPELIFANQVQLLDVNFISEIKDGSEYYLGLEDTSTIRTLRSIVAAWYVTLRTIAIIGMLSVLVYVGIRIIISSAAGEKAKYKEQIKDWIVAFCLLFFMHYIMAGVITIVGRVNEMLAANIDLVEGLELNPEYGSVVYNPDIQENGDNESISQGTVGSWGMQSGTGYSDVLMTIGTTVFCVDDNGMETMLFGPLSEGKIRATRPSEAITDEEKANKVYTITYETVDADTQGRRNSLTLNFDLVKSSSNPTIGPAYVGRIRYSASNPAGSLPVKFKTTGENIPDMKYFVDQYHKSLEDQGYHWADIPIEDEDDVKDEDDDRIISNNGQPVRVASDARISGNHVLYFTNYARMYLNVNNDDDNQPMAIAYLIIYVALIAFTLVFAIRYIKRVIYVAFLTLIAPLVALTYPIDKLKDRKGTSLEYVV